LSFAIVFHFGVVSTALIHEAYAELGWEELLAGTGEVRLLASFCRVCWKESMDKREVSVECGIVALFGFLMTE
jgi:hypothetical protein